MRLPFSHREIMPLSQPTSFASSVCEHLFFILQSKHACRNACRSILVPSIINNFKFDFANLLQMQQYLQQMRQNLTQMLQFLDLRQKIFAKSPELYIYIILFLYTYY